MDDHLIHEELFVNYLFNHVIRVRSYSVPPKPIWDKKSVNASIDVLLPHIRIHLHRSNVIKLHPYSCLISAGWYRLLLTSQSAASKIGKKVSPAMFSSITVK